MVLREKSVHGAEYRLLIQRLSEARQRVGLSQRRVSALLEMPFTFMQKVESFERQINPVELMNCCRVMDVDFVQFLSDYKAEVDSSRTSP